MPEARLSKHLLEAYLRTSSSMPSRKPVSCYRLQFNSNFKFKMAEAIIPYLKSLGITDVYSSPYFKARPGSEHGYDVTDYTVINPELGTEEDFNSFSDALISNEMGLIMDIVPNHMSISSGSNPWWDDMLENGQASNYAEHFDIDWDPVNKALKDKVLIPILGRQYGEVLDSGELKLDYGFGAFFIIYFDHTLPLDPGTTVDILGSSIKLLEESQTSNDPNLLELMSILTAIKNLPGRTETNKDKVNDRVREKEFIKIRLDRLYLKESCVREAIIEAVNIINQDINLLDRLLDLQAYRLSFWQVATEEINYRRFFDINDLAAIRNERDSTFRLSHSLILKHIAQGKISGLRVDHPDGLYDPEAYFKKLQRECFISLVEHNYKNDGLNKEDREAIGNKYDEDLSCDSSFFMPFFIVGEKILTDSERLPKNWPVAGTTGYSFMNAVGGLYVDSLKADVVTDIYHRFIKRKPNFKEMLHEKKMLIMNSFMAGEINMLGKFLDDLSEEDRRYRDFTLNSLVEAISETIAHFPVYRTYVTSSSVQDKDRVYIESAINKAAAKRHDLPDSLFIFIKDVLTLNYPEHYMDSLKVRWLEFAMRFQQITGPVMAKGLEDTVFYNYCRLVSLNEVGGNPSRFGTSREAYHGQNIERSKHWNYSLTATSTHDHKRSEDIRLRISVLSEIPEIWKELLVKWKKINKKHKTNIDKVLLPDSNDEFLLYQTLLGSWPDSIESTSDYPKRIKRYMIKASREAKVNTTWISPDHKYEEAMELFVDSLIGSSEFISSFEGLQKTVSFYGMLNSLSMSLLKITSPGVPDFYQGTETCSLTLVDPDNRALVDHNKLIKMLREITEGYKHSEPANYAYSLLENIQDGRAKLFLIWMALNQRANNRELFLEGSYAPIIVQGQKSRSVVATIRSHGSSSVICIAPRLLVPLVKEGQMPLGNCWEDTHLLIPNEIRTRSFTDVFTRTRVPVREEAGQKYINVSEALAHFPVCILEIDD